MELKRDLEQGHSMNLVFTYINNLSGPGSYNIGGTIGNVPDYLKL